MRTYSWYWYVTWRPCRHRWRVSSEAKLCLDKRPSRRDRGEDEVIAWIRNDDGECLRSFGSLCAQRISFSESSSNEFATLSKDSACAHLPPTCDSAVPPCSKYQPTLPMSWNRYDLRRRDPANIDSIITNWCHVFVLYLISSIVVGV